MFSKRCNSWDGSHSPLSLDRTAPAKLAEGGRRPAHRRGQMTFGVNPTVRGRRVTYVKLKEKKAPVVDTEILGSIIESSAKKKFDELVKIMEEKGFKGRNILVKRNFARELSKVLDHPSIASMKQYHTVFRKIVSTTKKGRALKLLSEVAREMINFYRNEEMTEEAVQEVLTNISRAAPEERSQLMDYLISSQISFGIERKLPRDLFKLYYEKISTAQKLFLDSLQSEAAFFKAAVEKIMEEGGRGSDRFGNPYALTRMGLVANRAAYQKMSLEELLADPTGNGWKALIALAIPSLTTESFIFITLAEHLFSNTPSSPLMTERLNDCEVIILHNCEVVRRHTVRGVRDFLEILDRSKSIRTMMSRVRSCFSALRSGAPWAKEHLIGLTMDLYLKVNANFQINLEAQNTFALMNAHSVYRKGGSGDAKIMYDSFAAAYTEVVGMLIRDVLPRFRRTF